jgi:2-polyprenyl-6-methoxyphenol hydroxylase-like FAD-dependent oxidoreductase
VAGVRDAEVTIIGGGAVGCAVAFTLARAGYRDIQLIERGELAGATSGQAAGLVGQVRSTAERCRLAMASVALMLPSPFRFLVFAGTAMLLTSAARHEERKFAGSPLAREYESYRRRTGRFFPRLQGRHRAGKPGDRRP